MKVEYWPTEADYEEWGEATMRATKMAIEYDLSGIYLKIARDIHRMGVYLQCKPCGKQRVAGPTAIACYLRDGWPECCGETMHLMTDETQNQSVAYQGA